MFYIFETQTRPDGVINCCDPVSRSTEQLGRSYFCERCSKAYASEQFTEVGVILVDASMRVYDVKTCQTSYVAPETEETATE